MGRIHLGTIRGTTLSLDFSFLILIAFFVFPEVQSMGMQHALLWAPVLLISILIHELAHAGMIGALGFGPSEVVLGGIGGATYNQRQARPWQDLLISAAGPASSFALAWLIGLAASTIPFASRDPFFRALLPLLIRANLWWGVFNLIPVGPLDGFSVILNFLRLFLRERLAFPIAIWTSMIVGVVLAVLSLATRWIFLSLLMFWYVHSSWTRWQFYRQTNRTDE